jgi:catechol 2,3-dioxygenase-like lactoylglutathione lyase family enzyme
MPTRPSIGPVIETSIFVDDTEKSARFYERVLGLRVMSVSERLASLDVAGKSVFLIFKKGGSTQPTIFEGGTIPPNDASGSIHFALSISQADFQDWVDWLGECSVEIESIVNWERGGRSIYFRDLDGHNVELATPGIWEIY